jgi:hypothetical protein
VKDAEREAAAALFGGVQGQALFEKLSKSSFRPQAGEASATSGAGAGGGKSGGGSGSGVARGGVSAEEQKRRMLALQNASSLEEVNALERQFKLADGGQGGQDAMDTA